LAVDVDDYRWLVSEAAGPWLAIVRAEVESGESTDVALVSRLRRELSPERAHLVVEQVELRRRAREKFALADQMYFTRKGLEQATDEQVAAYKASRFPQDEWIVDLCCGIGGDLLAFAARGKAVGIDRDPVMAVLAGANAAAHGYDDERCRVVVQDASESDVGSGCWHCDPDRRAGGRRTTRGELFEPPLDVIDRLLTQNSRAAIKLAPATEAPPVWAGTGELEWISRRGECRQQVAWFGSLALHAGRRAATVISDSAAIRTIVGESSHDLPLATGIGKYIYEPDAAVLAAKLVAELSRQHALPAVSAGIAYLTSDERIDDLALAAFEVLDVLPLDRKQLRAYCRERRLGRLEIKKRGADIDPERLRKEIASEGDEEATIIVAPVSGKTRALITRRLARSD
jgi:SAM-dependent methyltransferase